MLFLYLMGMWSGQTFQNRTSQVKHLWRGRLNGSKHASIVHLLSYYCLSWRSSKYTCASMEFYSAFCCSEFIRGAGAILTDLKPSIIMGVGCQLCTAICTIIWGNVAVSLLQVVMWIWAVNLEVHPHPNTKQHPVGWFCRSRPGKVVCGSGNREANLRNVHVINSRWKQSFI